MSSLVTESLNLTVNVPSPDARCCSDTCTEDVRNNSLTTVSSGGFAGAALPSPAYVFRTRFSVCCTERPRSATSSASRVVIEPHERPRLPRAQDLRINQRDHLGRQIEEPNEIRYRRP